MSAPSAQLVTALCLFALDGPITAEVRQGLRFTGMPKIYGNRANNFGFVS